jgi:hypothetical protein
LTTFSLFQPFVECCALQQRGPKRRLLCSANAAQQCHNVGFAIVDGLFESCVAGTAGGWAKHENNKTQNQKHILNMNAHRFFALTSALLAISSWQAAG